MITQLKTQINVFEKMKLLAEKELCPKCEKEYKRERVRVKKSNTYYEVEHSKDDYCYISADMYKYVLTNLPSYFWAYKRGLVSEQSIHDLIFQVIDMAKVEAKDNKEFKAKLLEKIKELEKELGE